MDCGILLKELLPRGYPSEQVLMVTYNQYHSFYQQQQQQQQQQTRTTDHVYSSQYMIYFWVLHWTPIYYIDSFPELDLLCASLTLPHDIRIEVLELLLITQKS